VFTQLLRGLPLHPLANLSRALWTSANSCDVLIQSHFKSIITHRLDGRENLMPTRVMHRLKLRNANTGSDAIFLPSFIEFQHISLTRLPRLLRCTTKIRNRQSQGSFDVTHHRIRWRQGTCLDDLAGCCDELQKIAKTYHWTILDQESPLPKLGAPVPP
jgi:hypothetical protein